MSRSDTYTPLPDGLHRAGWVLKDPWTAIPNGYVRVASGIVCEIGTFDPRHQESAAADRYDYGPGVLMPALVNAHTHLELSGFKGKIDCSQGFGPWVRDLLKAREKSSPADIAAGTEEGLQALIEAGTGTLCEISSLGLSVKPVASSGLFGLWCRELLGNHTGSPEETLPEMNGRIAPALAGHAPHTTSPIRLQHLKRTDRAHHVIFPIHVAESDAEMEFIRTGRGEWADFLHERGIDFSNWDLPADSPVAHLDSLGLLDRQTLAVHVLQTDDRDLDLLQDRGTPVCVCPRSNLALHGRLPDLAAMLARGIRPCLGTDSLASTPSLDLFDEMAFVANQYDAIAPEQILAMATVNGAEALRQTGLGRLGRNCMPQMIYTPLAAASKKQLIETVTHQGFSEPCRPLFMGTRNGDR